MQFRIWIFNLIIATILALPISAHSQTNIYRDAIPHIKACISLIEERETTAPETAGRNVDLRDVCPSFAYFLTYEPISEIDPPLENQSSRAYLESLLVLLETGYQTQAVPANFAGLETSENIPRETEQKPFLMAMAQWTFAHVHNLIGRMNQTVSPRVQHTIYIITLNLIIVAGMCLLLLYAAAVLKKSKHK